jgi:biopolymer transport protein ExbD
MKLLDKEAEAELQIRMEPMIDCVFLLIIFFLVTTSFIKLEQDLSIQLPVQSREIKARKPPARPIVVNIRYVPGGKPTYLVENERMTLPLLTVNFSRARMRNKEQSVIIRGDRRVRWEHVAAVMGCCAQAGIVKVSATVEITEQG